jgi:hypothetical protein
MASIKEQEPEVDFEILKKQANEFLKIKERIRRHGANIVKSRGRKKTTNSQKKKRRDDYRERIKNEKIANGTYRPRGRPRKPTEII